MENVVGHRMVVVIVGICVLMFVTEVFAWISWESNKIKMCCILFVRM